MPAAWQLVERRLLASGKVRVTVSLGPGRRINFTVDRDRADDERIQLLVDAAVARGRFDPLPPREFG